MTNLKTEIQEAMQLHCKGIRKENTITEYLEQNLTSEKHLKPIVDLQPSFNENEWTLDIHITYTSLNVYDIETVYSVVSQVKELFSGMSYALTSYAPTNGGIAFKIILEG